jgi:hypothetical protein
VRVENDAAVRLQEAEALQDIEGSSEHSTDCTEACRNSTACSNAEKELVLHNAEKELVLHNAEKELVLHNGHHELLVSAGDVVRDHFLERLIVHVEESILLVDII